MPAMERPTTAISGQVETTGGLAGHGASIQEGNGAGGRVAWARGDVTEWSRGGSGLLGTALERLRREGKGTRRVAGVRARRWSWLEVEEGSASG